jgi:hypothetical protein
MLQNGEFFLAGIGKGLAVHAFRKNALTSILAASNETV